MPSLVSPWLEQKGRVPTPPMTTYCFSSRRTPSLWSFLLTWQSSLWLTALIFTLPARRSQDCFVQDNTPYPEMWHYKQRKKYSWNTQCSMIRADCPFIIEPCLNINKRTLSCWNCLKANHNNIDGKIWVATC